MKLVKVVRTRTATTPVASHDWQARALNTNRQTDTQTFSKLDLVDQMAEEESAREGEKIGRI